MKYLYARRNAGPSAGAGRRTNPKAEINTLTSSAFILPASPMRIRITGLLSLLWLLSMTSCRQWRDFIDEPKPRGPQIKTLAAGLKGPLGIETDAQGQLWITQAGTGLSADGQLTLITPQGNRYPVVTGFASRVSPEGAVFGLNHLLLKDQVLYLLHGVEGKLYQFDCSTFKPGDTPMQASQLPYEDIGTFVKAHHFERDTDESDVFNLTTGPDGDLFIVDAAANAIIRRHSASGELSVFATLPPLATPSGEPAQVEAVPTGIVFDGRQFLVSTFTGFPYPPIATIYQVDRQGNPSVYQTGLSTLTDIELGIDHKPVVVEYGTWTGESFAPNSGRIVRATAGKNTALLTGLNFPNSIERSGQNTYYIARTLDGLIQKVTY